MNIVWTIGLRYIFPRYQQRAVSVMAWIAFAGVALGSATLILALSVLGGFEQALYNNALQFTAHIQMQTDAGMPFINKNTLVRDILMSDVRIREVVPFIRQEAILRTPSGIEGIIVKADAEYAEWRNTHIVRGVPTFAADTAHTIVVSERLARKLNTDLGQSVILYSIAAHRQAKSALPTLTDINALTTRIDRFTIVGIYQTGIAEYDDMMVFMPYYAAREFFDLPEMSATGCDIILHERDSIESVRRSLLVRYGKHADVWTMYEIHSSMFSWIALQQKPLP